MRTFATLNYTNCCYSIDPDTISESICDGEFYTSPSGNLNFSETGVYQDTIPNAAGCENIYTINLTVNSINLEVTELDNVLSTSTTDATYQWIDCGNNNEVIESATAADFAPLESGNYAVEITKDGCTEISDCYSVEIIISASNDLLKSELKVYPNPSKGLVHVDLGDVFFDVNIKVMNVIDETVMLANHRSLSTLDLQLPDTNGLYFLEIKTTAGDPIIVKLLRE